MSLERLRSFREAEDLPHLSAEYESIFATVEDWERISISTREEVTAEITSGNMVHLLFGIREKNGEKEGVKHGSSENDMTFVISPVTSKSIESSGYHNCQGVLVSGCTAEGTRLAFMTHHNPELFTDQIRTEEFEECLLSRLQQLTSTCERGSLDAILFGGDAHQYKDDISDFDSDDKNSPANIYRLGVKRVASVAEQAIGFTPRIVEGPRVLPDYFEGESEPKYSGQSAVFITRSAHLHIIVAKAAENSGGVYEVSRIEDLMEK